jgi:hypothetical protein
MLTSQELKLAAHRLLPFLAWWPMVTRTSLRDDLLAGFTGALIVLPQGVAFATIAGLPPQYGLYAAMVPAIVAAVGDQIEVWMDGGIRSGQDVLKAWALGARGTMIGRAMVYGLGAMGEEGVLKALQIIHKELDITMAFCGHTDIRTVDKKILIPGTSP